jgi:hypothetical protein
LNPGVITAALCDAVGWTYRRLGGLPDVLSANLRWLAGYRHDRVSDNAIVARVRQVVQHSPGISLRRLAGEGWRTDTGGSHDLSHAVAPAAIGNGTVTAHIVISRPYLFRTSVSGRPDRLRLGDTVHFDGQLYEIVGLDGAGVLLQTREADLGDHNRRASG